MAKKVSVVLIFSSIGLVGLLVGMCVLAYIMAPKVSEYPYTDNELRVTDKISQNEITPTSIQIKPSEVTPTPTNTMTPKPIDKLEIIEEIVDKYDSKLSTTVFNKKGEFGTPDNGPYEIFVTSNLFAYSVCNGARIQILDIMRALYTDSRLQGSIIRVDVSLSDQAQASLGYNYAKTINEETWKRVASSTFAQALYSNSSVKYPFFRTQSLSISV